MVFAIVALALGGCDNDDITGGGWIGTDNGKKVNFSFNFKCKCDDNGPAKVSGQLQYNDRDGDVRFHGVVDSLVSGGTCDGLLNSWEGRYCGSYTPQPRKLGAGGTFEIHLVDNGEGGPSKGDELTLSLVGGVHDRYKIDATLEGGNIQAHGAKTRK
jgi:hypothetical protein